jgi:hypothetical protein
MPVFELMLVLFSFTVVGLLSGKFIFSILLLFICFRNEFVLLGFSILVNDSLNLFSFIISDSVSTFTFFNEKELLFFIGFSVIDEPLE